MYTKVFNKEIGHRLLSETSIFKEAILELAALLTLNFIILRCRYLITPEFRRFSLFVS